MSRVFFTTVAITAACAVAAPASAQLDSGGRQVEKASRELQRGRNTGSGSRRVQGTARSSRPARSAGSDSRDERPEGYSVVRVGDEVQVLSDDELKALKEQVTEKYQQEMKAYEEARKAAAREKTRFESPKPVRPPIRVLAGNIATRQEAEERREKALEPPPKREPRAAPRKPPASREQDSGERFVVVQRGDELQVLPAAEADALRKQIDGEYQREMEAYNSARAEAVKRKEKFHQTRPARPPFKVFSGSFKSQEAAEEFRSKKASRG